MNAASMAALSIRRLHSEHREVMGLNVPGFITVDPEGPPGGYQVTVHAKSYVGVIGGGLLLKPGPFRFRVSCPSGYPVKPPAVHFIGSAPGHINVFSSNQVCIGSWQGWKDSLAALVLRVVRLTLFYPDSMNFKSAASASYISASKRLIKQGKCPTDSRPLPTAARP